MGVAVTKVSIQNQNDSDDNRKCLSNLVVSLFDQNGSILYSHRIGDTTKQTLINIPIPCFFLTGK